MFCYICNRIYPGEDCVKVVGEHPHHNDTTGYDFPGVFIQTDFLNETEEYELMNGIDSLKWDVSQSGRRKQVRKYLRSFKAIISNLNLFLFRTMDPKQISKK